MIQNIIRGYKKIFTSAFKIILLVLVCLLIGLAVVWPLWYFSVNSPKIYSVCTILGIIIFFLYFLIQFLKKTPTKTILSVFLQIFILCFGIAASIFCVLHLQRLLSIGILIITFVVFGICKFGLKDK